ncbi:MAG: aminoglycoside phosphotransferase family protein [Candidatus Sumerlaeota bacterium]|nr:aminoglycoside phosphotransferase family protein [Candidatus Sumerlaeota bacterium]
MKRLKYDIPTIARQFAIWGQFKNARPYGSGHINDTFAVTFNQGGARVRYILQRINHNIFKNPPALMENVVRVTDHVRLQLQERGVADVSRRVLTVIPARDGAYCHRDAEGAYWRAYIFIEKARTHDTLESPEQARKAACCFGEFQRQLVDLPAPPLHDTIPNFHSGPMRYQAFEKALAADICNRAAQAGPEIEFLHKHAWIFDVLPGLVGKGEIPVRTTHNDTKINNVMLDDKTGEGICVIDLDTVMPGLALYDFGDIVRTTVSPAAEDERDLSKVVIEMPRFEAILRGYLSSAGAFLNKAERAHLIFAGKLITLIIGARFLTDFLAGDTYFKIHRDGHNLDRSRTQFRIVQLIEKKEEALQRLANQIS